jgi:hypothetical protein
MLTIQSFSMPPGESIQKPTQSLSRGVADLWLLQHFGTHDFFSHENSSVHAGAKKKKPRFEQATMNIII